MGLPAPEEFRLLTAPERLSAYQFNTYTGTHFHGAKCGCATHGTSPDYCSGKADFSKTAMSYTMRMAHGFDRATLPVERHDGARY